MSFLDDERTFRFCRAWLLLAALLSIVIGALLVLAAGTPLFLHYNQSAADAFWGGRALSDAALAHHQWALGLSGAGTMGWALTLGFVAAVPFQRKEPWAWWCMFSSVLLWVAVDVGASLYWGVGAEVIFVGCAGAAMLLPLAMARPHFQPRRARPSS